ncbi:MAG: TlpA disulfide reductase family protein, partial [Cytophagales bacterium]|nr:TlpA disulfide reductase family protein [Cytophagales bacterium]
VVGNGAGQKIYRVILTTFKNRHMRQLFICLLFFACYSISFGQKSYFKTNEGTIIDSVTYVKPRNSKIEKLKTIDKQVAIQDNLKEIYRNSDSIIFTYHWDIRIGAGSENSKSFHPDKYLRKELPFPIHQTLNGDNVDISSLKGKPTLINFWFTSCAPCIDEMPILNRLKDKYGDSVNFIAITFDSKEKVSKFLKKYNYAFNQIAGAKQYIQKDLEMRSFPVNIFLDKNGVAQFIQNGIPYQLNEKKKLVIGDGKEFDQQIDTLLKM